MVHRFRWVGSFTCLFVSVLPACNLLTAALHGVVAPNSNLTLMDLAELLVAPKYPNALLIEALGAVNGGSGMTAADVTKWQFRFSENPNVAGSGTVWVNHEDGQFSNTFYTPQGLFGTEFVRIPRTMTLEQAIQKIRGAGFGGAFSAVTVRKPLTFPPPQETFYIFSLPGAFVLVGMESGTVTSEAGPGLAATFLEP